jgi:two-component system nitrogen regulation sensor histidine kinase NtrY
LAKGDVIGIGEESATGPIPGSRRRIGAWAPSNTAIATALLVAAGFAFFTTWFLLSPAVETADRTLLLSMVLLNVAIAAGFVTLVGLRLWHVWSDRRHQLAGSQTHMRLAGMFALVAVAPAVIAFLFALTILRTSLNDVFSDRVERYNETARDVANALVEMRTGELELTLNQIAFDIRRNEDAGAGLEAAPIGFRQYLMAQAQVRGLAAIYLVSEKGNPIVRAEITERPYNLPPAAILDQLAESPPGSVVFGVSDDKKFDMFRGALKLPDYGGGILIVYEPIDSRTSAQLIAVSAMRRDWDDARRGRGRAENVFALGYAVLATIILSGAVWVALWAATRLVQPIGRLVKMADRVSAGDLGARVEVSKDDGELGALARAMNHMTAQLQTQRNDLIETNKQFDRRRRFTEAVLSGVSAGVVGVDADGRVTIANRFAADFLGMDAGRLAGAAVADILPELQGLFTEAGFEPGREVGDEIELDRHGRKRTISVRIVAYEMDGKRSHVVTFDDITQLISAQRNAAWGDVARRIAHEIKNPLTPIQLSAERLRRKYLGEITTQPDIFDKCTETIIRHVNDIGRMVDEFSSFARMPKPVISREDLRELVKSAIFPQRVANADIQYIFEGPERPCWVLCDGRLIVQALSNLLKNAAESVAARASGEGGGEAAGGVTKVVLAEMQGFMRVDVIDNGVGLPKAERHRLTEPYMTTRDKGTGLGLAIVRKVVEEHGGYLEFDDDLSLGRTGARVSLVLPAEAAPGSRLAAEATAAE